MSFTGFIVYGLIILNVWFLLRGLAAYGAMLRKTAALKQGTQVSGALAQGVCQYSIEHIAHTNIALGKIEDWLMKYEGQPLPPEIAKEMDLAIERLADLNTKQIMVLLQATTEITKMVTLGVLEAGPNGKIIVPQAPPPSSNLSA